MTETEKTFNNIVSVYKPVKIKKIVTEAKEIKKESKTIKKESAKKSIKKNAELQVQLDEMQKSFISKYIEYSELSLLNQSAEQLTATFEKSLGQNAQAAIKQLMQKIEQRDVTIKNLAKELNTLKQQMIKETEKARAKETLIGLASNIAVPVEKSKPQINQPDKMSNATNVSQVPADTVNVIESKKKKK